MSKSLLLKIALVSLVCLSTVTAFVQTTAPLKSFSPTQKTSFQRWQPASSTQLWDRRDDDDVQVNLIPDVDAVTLTAIGFGLIAFNFLVLANAGDGGIAGVLATIINTLNQ